MKKIGSWSELVSILFKKNSQDITLKPNTATTYTAARDVELPPGDTAHELTSATSTSTLTNKTIDADNNTISNLAHGAEVDNPSSGVHGVTGSVVGTSDSQVITNKDIDGGTASNTSRLTVPSATKATLDGLTRKEATLMYSTDLDKLFVDDGTNLNEVGSGSGSGEINYILNPDAEVNTDGYAEYDDGAVAAPVDGTGGTAANLTLTRTTTTSELVRGTASFKLAKAAADAQGEGISYDFTIDPADENKILKIAFDYKTTTNYASGDVVVYIYDVTNATLITPSVTSLVKKDADGGGEFLSTFVTTTSNSYRLILHVATTNASAYDVFFDNVVVGPGKIATGAVVTEWQPITLTPTNLPETSQSFFYKREGETMILRGSLTASGAATGTISLALPSGYTIDYSKLSTASYALLGTCSMLDLSPTGRHDGVILTNNTATNSLVFSGDDGTDLWNASAPIAAWASGDRLEVVDAQLPIVEWASSGVSYLVQENNLTGWETFSVTSSVTNATHVGYKRRVGQNIELLYQSTMTGTPASAVVTYDYPSGITPDTSVLIGAVNRDFLGSGTIRDTGTGATYPISSEYNDASSLRVNYHQDDQASSTNPIRSIAANLGATGPITGVSGDTLTLYVTFPVAAFANQPSPFVGFAEAAQDQLGLVSAGQWKGTNTNDNAATGYVGEHVLTNNSSFTNYGATNTYTDADSITLTPGDWDITAMVTSALVGSTLSFTDFFIGTVAGNNTTGRVLGLNHSSTNAPTSSSDETYSVPNYRVSISTTTTYYLKVRASYSAGTPQYLYSLQARRAR